MIRLGLFNFRNDEVVLIAGDQAAVVALGNHLHAEFRSGSETVLGQIRWLVFSKIYLGDILKNWIGKWVIFVALGHSVMASILFGKTYRDMVINGLYNSVNSEKIGLAVWFFLFGLILFVVGMVISVIEKNGLQISKSIGVALLLPTIIGVVLMPVSGFWLMFPAILAIFYRRTPAMQEAMVST